MGGFFTIDHAAAAEVVDALEPRIVIPMHYKTDKVDFPIAAWTRSWRPRLVERKERPPSR